MLKMLITNNLIAVAIHVCICLVLIIPLGLLIGPGHLWSESTLELLPLWHIAKRLIAIGIYTAVAIILYFWAGRKFLTNTDNMLTSILSVIALTIVIILATFAAEGSFGNRLRYHLLAMLTIPIGPIGATVAHFLRIDNLYSYLIMSIMPSLAMWVGMVTKR